MREVRVLEELVREGRTGRKAGKKGGFYEY